MDILGSLPFPLWWILVGVVVLVLLAALGGRLAGGRKKEFDLDTQRGKSKQWASGRELKELWLRDDAPDPRRIILGYDGRHPVQHTGLHRSLAVISPSGTGKTPRVVVPAILRHRGPCLATSIKSDFLQLTIAHRRSLGPVWVIDPAGDSGETQARWSPLLGITTYADAVDVAALLTKSSRRATNSSANDEFWDALARKFLGPLLLAAAQSKATMLEVGEWVDTHDDREAREILEDLGDRGALSALKSFERAEPRTKANMVSSAVKILESWTHPVVAGMVDTNASNGGPILDLDQLIDAPGGRLGTLYMVGTRARQETLSPVFEMLSSTVVTMIEERFQRTAMPLSPPLLAVLDEAANICRVRDLDGWASALAGQGMILISVWQDESQIAEAYGKEKARAVLGNHTGKAYLPGITDDETLTSISKMVGQDSFHARSVSAAQDVGMVNNNVSVTTSTAEHDVVTSSWYRKNITTGQALVFIGSKPTRLKLPGWWELDELTAKVPAGIAERFNQLHAAPSRRRGRQLASPAAEPPLPEEAPPAADADRPASTEPQVGDTKPKPEVAAEKSEGVAASEVVESAEASGAVAAKAVWTR